MDQEKRLLIVDDDKGLLLLLKDAFELEGYSVYTCSDAHQALRYVEKHGLPHLALIDLDLPVSNGFGDGFSLSDRLKHLGDVPIVFITGNNATDTVVSALTHYADDYVVKPFKIRELIARVNRVLSRISISEFMYAQTPAIVVDKHLSVDFGKSRLMLDDKTVSLTPTEASLLHILMRNAGRVVPSETLISRVWPAEEVFEDTLRVHMHRLRRKIEPDRNRPRYIHTERGVGYRFASMK